MPGQSTTSSRESTSSLPLEAVSAVEDAVRASQRALMEDPRNPRLCQQLVCALEQLGRRDEAVGAWFSLGAALEEAGRWQEAEVAYREAVARKPDCLRALIKLGQTLLELAQPARARAQFEAALAIVPDQQEARIGLGWASQLLGDVTQGWEAFAWEFPRSQTRRRHLEQPVWDGSPLDGRTILLWVDWGLGDTIQFVRYAQVLKAQGARIIAECQSRLVPLIERMPCVDRVITPRMPLPPFDVHAPLLLLPALVGTRMEIVPDAPYLTADSVLMDVWRERLDRAHGRRIGIAWGARPIPPRRSAPLLTFARVARVPGVRLINLQHGPPLEELATAPEHLRVETFAEEPRSIDETAALIMNLDLVVTVDTMIAHLAGALGAPVWTLLPYAPNWRWQGRGETTPWYSSMRLFRQTRPGDWTGVMLDVAAALEATAPHAMARSSGRRSDRD
jgi:hypothetical protein